MPAEEATGRETNLLRKVYSIRNYVYDQLSYGIKPHIDTPDIALRSESVPVGNMWVYYWPCVVSMVLPVAR
jgi:hypothetical protein